MKYFRTKDGRMFECFDDGIIADFDTPRPTYVADDYILKQANTIEELCDEFIYVNKEKDIKCFCLLHQPITTIYYGAQLEDVETKKLINDKNIEIYGAIWTDKGLIYVAKMNKEGALELL